MNSGFLTFRSGIATMILEQTVASTNLPLLALLPLSPSTQCRLSGSSFHTIGLPEPLGDRPSGMHIFSAARLTISRCQLGACPGNLQPPNGPCAVAPIEQNLVVRTSTFGGEGAIDLSRTSALRGSVKGPRRLRISAVGYLKVNPINFACY